MGAFCGIIKVEVSLVSLRTSELAPCGVFCGACPSYPGTCLGCSSEEKGQSRKSKWGCKIRECCYHKEQKEFCSECDEFPCKIHRKKLMDSHPGDKKYKYRHEIAENFDKLKELGTGGYLEYQRKRWTCEACGGRITMYHYKCCNCGKEHFV